MALDRVTDSLEAALGAVPLRGQRFDGEWEEARDGQVYQATEPDFPALAAAAREWLHERRPGPIWHTAGEPRDLRQQWEETGYNTALADVSRRLWLP